MDLGLKGKKIIVTGGARGIGGAISDCLYEEGAIPIIIDRDEEASTKKLENLSLDPGTYFFFADLSLPKNCQKVAEEILAKHPSIDGLVNNAGVNDAIGLEKGNPAKFLESLQINLVQVYSITHYLLPRLKMSSGPIVNIGSKTAVTGQGGTSGYVAAKGGLLGLTREWAVELLPYHIRVNTVVPAEVFTPLYEHYLNTFPDPAEALKKVEDKIPLERRMTTPKEIADMAVFLLSERSSHTTGQILFVDGGYTHLDRAVL